MTNTEWLILDALNIASTIHQDQLGFGATAAQIAEVIATDDRLADDYTANLRALQPRQVSQHLAALSGTRRGTVDRTTGLHPPLGEHLRNEGKLPVDFMLLQPPSWHPDVWTDVARMRTLNTVQAQRAREQHLCPMPFDIAKRLISRYSNEGDLVLDPFAGIGTVPLESIRLRRRGLGIELNPVYFLDAIQHLEDEARRHAMPTLFDALAALEAA